LLVSELSFSDSNKIHSIKGEQENGKTSPTAGGLISTGEEGRDVAEYFLFNK